MSQVSPEGLSKGIKLIIIIIAIGVIVEFLPEKYKVLPNLTVGGNTSEVINKNLSSEVYRVSNVVDGDTVDVQSEGATDRVRLLGIDTPETVDPNRPVGCYGKEASARAKELMLNQNVRLEFDSSQAHRDKYDRLLAYIYLEDGQMINRKLVAEGYAYEYTYNSPYKYQKDFKGIEAIAKSLNRGLWSPDTCNGTK